MRFRPDTLRRIARGEVTLAFRRWRTPSVRAGSTLHTPLGLLAIDGLDAVEARDVSDQEATLAGYPDRASLLRELRGEGSLYRIALSPLRREQMPTPERRTDASDELAALCDKLQALDRRALSGPWTARTLHALRDRDGLSPAQLAALLHREPEQQLTRNLRKLAGLGLCERCELGYRLSARGAAVLARLEP